jgi:hypothetical protein
MTPEDAAPAAKLQPKSRHADWHRETFTRRTAATVVWPGYVTPFGHPVAEVVHEVTLNSARAVVAQRIVNSLSPSEWELVMRAFDSSHEGVDLDSKVDHVRREHAELWLLRAIYEGEHEDMVTEGELALQKVLDHHAQPAKIAKHKDAVLATLAEVK